jgi:hypothetical protein
VFCPTQVGADACKRNELGTVVFLRGAVTVMSAATALVEMLEMKITETTITADLHKEGRLSNFMAYSWILGKG